MAFTNHKIDPADLAARTTAMRTGFMASGKPGTFEENAVRVIRERLQRNPMQYLEFGPYWWAVKTLLRESWPQLSDAGDAAIAAEFRGADAAQTMVAAETFKDGYRRQFFVGANTFQLDDDGEAYTLEDPDMMRLAGRAG